MFVFPSTSQQDCIDGEEEHAEQKTTQWEGQGTGDEMITEYEQKTTVTYDTVRDCKEQSPDEQHLGRNVSSRWKAAMRALERQRIINAMRVCPELGVMQAKFLCQFFKLVLEK